MGIAMLAINVLVSFAKKPVAEFKYYLFVPLKLILFLSPYENPYILKTH